MEDDEEITLLKRLDILQIKHRKIDKEIFSITQKNPQDQFSLHRLKREKLCVRDEINVISNLLNPDIIA